MIILNIDGGVGNQMFQYAFYRSLQHKGFDVRVFYSDATRQYSLDSFGVHMKEAPEEIKSVLATHMTGRNREKWILKQCFGLSKLLYLSCDVGLAYDARVLDLFRSAGEKTCYVRGLWQCEDWFADIKDEVRASFRFPKLTDPRNVEIRDRMAADSAAIALHVRHYLKDGPEWAVLDMPADYYRRLAVRARELYENPTFYVFSNDMAYAREILKEEPACVFVDHNRGASGSHLDMQLMTYAACNLISNSTLAWWGAWLNPLERDKHVIAPDGPWNRHPPTRAQKLRRALFRRYYVDTGYGNPAPAAWERLPV
jgi:hypothetical protein